MSKVLELFGVFYISLFVLLLLQLSSVRVPKISKLLQYFDKVVICFVFIWTTWVGSSVLSAEVMSISDLSKHSFKSFEEKIEYEHQYYSIYYVQMRPILLSMTLTNGPIRLVDLPVREYLLARGYLYPVGVLESGLINIRRGDVVIGTRDLVKSEGWRVIHQYHDRSLAIVDQGSIESEK